MSSWNFQDLTGQRFGKLTVLRKQSTTKDGQAVWVCVCDCGSIKTKQVFRYGENSVGDPQLYQVLQDHTSAAEWTPDTATSLYKAIGVVSGGYPEWVQPLGASDAYNTGDIVSYNGKLYQSAIDANVWAPDAYPAGWTEYTA